MEDKSWIDKTLESAFHVSSKRYPKLYDYFVDFFGILLPGVIFFSIFILIVLGLLNIICCYWFEYNISSISKGIAEFRVEFGIVSIAVSYLLGFLFFRKGTKAVDFRSVITNWDDIVNDNPPINISDQDKIPTIIDFFKSPIRSLGKWRKLLPLKWYGKRKELSQKVQWPYDNLKHYLECRLPHLAKLVPWDSEGTGSEEKGKKSQFGRSKTFMNILKDNIRFYLPDKYFTIARNEAHVRLSSSIWYAMRYLFRVSVITLILAIVTLYCFSNKNSNHFCYFYIVFCMLVIICAGFVKREIQKVLFYQRIREIVFILNTTYQAIKEVPNFGTELIIEGAWKKKDIDYIRESTKKLLLENEL